MRNFKGFFECGNLGLPLPLYTLLHPIHKDVQNLLIVMEGNRKIFQQFVPLPFKQKLKFSQRALKSMIGGMSTMASSFRWRVP